jgi:hypothetical protein
LQVAKGIAFERGPDGSSVVVNPFGAVVTQNKRLMALMWEELGAFSPSARSASPPVRRISSRG